MKNKNFYVSVYHLLIAMNKVLRSKKNFPKGTYEAILHGASLPHSEEWSMENTILFASLQKLALHLWKDKGFLGGAESPINQILRVGDVEDWKGRFLAFSTTKYGHQSKQYNAIDNYELMMAFIRIGMMPKCISRIHTNYREKTRARMSKEELVSREIHIMELTDYATLLSNDSKKVQEIWEKIGILPTLHVSNAHSGKNACFFSTSLHYQEYVINLHDSFPQKKLGERMEHIRLGEDNEELKKMINEKLSVIYAELCDLINEMQGICLNDVNKKHIQEEIARSLFGKRSGEYIIDWSVCRGAFIGDAWSAMHKMQGILTASKDGLPYKTPAGKNKSIMLNKVNRKGQKNTTKKNRVVSSILSVYYNAIHS